MCIIRSFREREHSERDSLRPEIGPEPGRGRVVIGPEPFPLARKSCFL